MAHPHAESRAYIARDRANRELSKAVSEQHAKRRLMRKMAQVERRGSIGGFWFCSYLTQRTSDYLEAAARASLASTQYLKTFT
jgi:hypothetical protein